MSATKSAHFLIFSDTHDIDPNATQLLKLPPADVILHCGDITENGDPENIKSSFEMLANMSAELKLVIAGNHDTTFDRKWFVAQGGDERECDQTAHLARQYQDRGLFYLEEGTHKFELSSGATFSIYASPYTPAHGISALQYPSAEDRFNPINDRTRPDWGIVSSSANLKESIIPDDVDIIMTHGPPKYILDRPSNRVVPPAVGCDHLRRAIERSRPLLHAFGHVHSGYGALRAEWKGENMEMLPKEWAGKNSAAKKGYASLGETSASSFLNANRDGNRGQTLFINAAIRDSQGVVANMPWYVVLEL